MALSKEGFVALVRDLLVLEAELILSDTPDVIMDFSSRASVRRTREEDMVDQQWQQLLDREESKVDVARRLYAEYANHTRRELPRLLRQLPKMASVLADAASRWTHSRVKLQGLTFGTIHHSVVVKESVPSREVLLSRYADPRQLELARLRQWAVKQLNRVRSVKGTNGDLVRVFVYLSLRDVCDWERIHVEQADMLTACVAGSFADVRNEAGAAGEWTVLDPWDQY